MSAQSRAAYIQQMSDTARSATGGTKIFPETALTVAILEGSGKDSTGDWKPGASKLAREANNHFAIKADNSWNGDVYTIETIEYERNPMGGLFPPISVPVTADFRKYDSVNDSYRDFVDFLRLNKRYAEAGVFTSAEPQSQLQAIANAGYATNPQYKQLLTAVYTQLKDVFKKYPGQTGTAAGGSGIIILLGLYLLTKKAA